MCVCVYVCMNGCVCDLCVLFYFSLWLPTDLGGVIDMGPGYAGAGLNNKQYGALCEIMGTASHMEFAAQATNCSSPGYDCADYLILISWSRIQVKVNVWLIVHMHVAPKRLL
jgi:hypothetical protein